VIELHDLAEDVRHARGALEASEHRERATDTNLGEQKLTIDVRRSRSEGAGVRREIVVELLERARGLLDGAPLQREELVHRDPIGPRRERALPIEATQLRDDLDERILGRILGVGRATEESEREPPDGGADGADKGDRAPRGRLRARTSRRTGHPSRASGRGP